MVIDMTNYLDFGSIFINEIIGDPMLAIIILMIVLVVAGIKMGLNEKVILIMLGISLILLVAIINSLVLKIVITGIFILLVVYGYKILRGG